MAAAPKPEAKPDPQFIVSSPITQQRTDTTVTQQHTAPALAWNGAIVNAPSAVSQTHTTQITNRAAPVVAAAPLVAHAPLVSSAVVASPVVHSAGLVSSWPYSGAYAYPSAAWGSPLVTSAHYSAPIVSSAYASPLVSSVYGYPAYSPYYSNYLLLKKKK